MQKTELLSILEGVGLSETESRVYMATLSLGPSTVLKIARSAEVKRTTVYSVIESLKQKGLIAIQQKGLKQLFCAQDPKYLETVLEERNARFKAAFGEFSALYNLGSNESTVQYFEGLTGIKNVYESLLQSVQPHDFYYAISDIQQWMALDERYFRHFVERRAKMPLNIKLLLIDSPVAQEFKQFERNFNESIKILPIDTALTTNLVVTPQYVVIQQLVPPTMAIVIQNKSIIQMHKEFFEIMWKGQA